jgi:hypothetical protein
MPNADHSAILPGWSNGEIVVIRRRLLSEVINRFHQISLPDSEPSFDDAITSFMVTSIAPSENDVHSNLPYGLAFLKYLVKKLDLHREAPGLSDEEKEERRRLVHDDDENRQLITSCRFLDYGGPPISSIVIQPYRSTFAFKSPIKNVVPFLFRVQTPFGKVQTPLYSCPQSIKMTPLKS